MHSFIYQIFIKRMTSPSLRPALRDWERSNLKILLWNCFSRRLVRNDTKVESHCPFLLSNGLFHNSYLL